MSLPEQQKHTTPFFAPDEHPNGAKHPCTGLDTDSGSSTGSSHGGRQHQFPVQVEATVFWWRTEERRAVSYLNQFGILPTMPVRFRCIGALTPKHPKRYRVELAQALDWLPNLTKRELKILGATLAMAVSLKIGVEVAPLSGDLFDLWPPFADG